LVDGKVIWFDIWGNPFKIERIATTLANVQVREDGGSYPNPALQPGDYFEIAVKCGQDGFDTFVNGQFLATFSGLHDRANGYIPHVENIQINTFSPTTWESSKFTLSYGNHY